MEIFLLRHGIAEDPVDAEAAGRGDPERRLTPEGVEKTTRVAHSFRKRISKLDMIFHSPYARARETARIFSSEFPDAKLAQATGLTPYDSAKSGLQLLQGLGAGKRISVMLVGHEPHLGSLASLLLTGHDRSVIEFKKAGIAGFEWEGTGQARLLFLVPPKFI